MDDGSGWNYGRSRSARPKQLRADWITATGGRVMTGGALTRMGGSTSNTCPRTDEAPFSVPCAERRHRGLYQPMRGHALRGYVGHRHHARREVPPVVNGEALRAVARTLAWLGAGRNINWSVTATSGPGDVSTLHAHAGPGGGLDYRVQLRQSWAPSAGGHLIRGQCCTSRYGRLHELDQRVPYGPREENQMHLAELGHTYDAVIFFRVGNATRHLDEIELYCPAAKIIFHTSDLHFLRFERQAEVEGSARLREDAAVLKERELATMQRTQATIVHSTLEKEMLDEMLGWKERSRIFVLGGRSDPGTTQAFADRDGMVFVGGYQHEPNVEAVDYFVREVFPLIRAISRKSVSSSRQPRAGALPQPGRRRRRVRGVRRDLARCWTAAACRSPH